MEQRTQPEQPRGFEQTSREKLSSRDELIPDSPDANAMTGEDGRSGNLEERRIANRGFAAMDREKQKRIASEGGRAAHKQGVAHEWNRDEAKEAGRKGGQIVSRNREHMSEIGRKGGQNSGQRRQRTEDGE